MSYPTVCIQTGRDKRFRSGSPWLFSNELVMDGPTKALEPGSLVRIMAGQGKIMGVAHFNPHTLIAARLLTRNKDAVIDEAFIRFRIERALSLRNRLYAQPFYRLIHAEGDGLPGLIIDRYGDVLAVQMNTAGMQALEPLICKILHALLKPKAIIARNDAPVRELEGLELVQKVLSGEMPQTIQIQENGLPFEIPLEQSQKTGWYFDQAENRSIVRRLADQSTVLDLYSYSGGFALNALAGGAKSAIAVDRSAPALEAAKASAELQGCSERFSTRQNDVFDEAASLAADKMRFDLVIADPPPFARAKKDLATGLRGYRKLARMSALLIREPGFLAIGCCSHSVDMAAFQGEVWAGIKAAGRGGRLIHSTCAGPDHPIHLGLPETAYLKFLVVALD